MSRCFPFPPPGYENKARPDNDDDLELIVKKDKDKRHKDKKAKDKKERSERKDKERAEGKHNEDKDRKQKKHRDKKDKKRDRQKSSEAIQVSGPSENQNGKKPGPDEKPGDWANGFRISAGIGKRVRNNDGPTYNKKAKHGSSEEKEILRPYIEKPGPDNSKPGNGNNGYRKSVEMAENQNAEKPGPDKKPGNGANCFRISVETGKRVGNDDWATDKKTENHIVGPSENQNGKKPGPDNKLDAGAHNDRILVEMGKRVRYDNGAKYNNYHDSMSNGHSLGVDAICSGNSSGEKRIMVENGSYQANKVEKKKEGREKKKNRDKSKKEDKKRKKEEKKDKVKEKSKEKVKQRASDVNLLECCASKPEDLLKESWDKQGKLPKLLEPVLNGVIHENGNRHDNMSRPAISSRQVSQNGTMIASPEPVINNVRDAEPGQTAIVSTPEYVSAHTDNHAVSNGLKTTGPDSTGKTTNGPDSTGKTINVLRRRQGKNNFSSRPPSASVKPKEKVKAAHPDLKYLSQILTVPELESSLFEADQEWLSGCKDAKRLNFRSSMVEWTDRVWAEAIRLESADVIALPYVIPY
ncbi:hypothetical protein CASFOL_022814 [Castilleja foliolosa]|uniref:Uncharacterized protein n=1 Tax=Castilleja foliolosa TaxID=1961234 RepID=A0ABD3CXG6_9LAMI